MKKQYKTTIVILGAMVFSTIAIQASDMLRNIDGNLTGLVIESGKVCGDGATEVYLSTGSLCVDIFEASAGKKCPALNPGTVVDTQKNLNNSECVAISEENTTPWRYVSLTQAQSLCARSGKRLPNNDEWYALASSISDQSSCIVSATGPSISESSRCASQAGVYDLVGNVWEWIDGEVYEGIYNSRPLPESGFVDMVDSDGVVVKTTSSANQEYNADYAVIDNSNIRGILRGGFYGSGDDAGIYAFNTSVPLDFKAPGVGFRCVKSI